MTWLFFGQHRDRDWLIHLSPNPHGHMTRLVREARGVTRPDRRPLVIICSLPFAGQFFVAGQLLPLKAPGASLAMLTKLKITRDIKCQRPNLAGTHSLNQTAQGYECRCRFNLVNGIKLQGQIGLVDQFVVAPRRTA